MKVDAAGALFFDTVLLIFVAAHTAVAVYCHIIISTKMNLTVNKNVN
jgi:hypothetical protein